LEIVLWPSFLDWLVPHSSIAMTTIREGQSCAHSSGKLVMNNYKSDTTTESKQYAHMTGGRPSSVVKCHVREKYRYRQTAGDTNKELRYTLIHNHSFQIS